MVCKEEVEFFWFRIFSGFLNHYDLAKMYFKYMYVYVYKCFGFKLTQDALLISAHKSPNTYV